ncbi:glycosyltransferase [Photobacterium leiognathi]|uniref:glycosyltransferase n=1 Tax=Photobacterium leiognathi TaxID=553611 RepID=UPI002981DDD4|nr:glycosyltransferase [Photobacterium leiognathi]
MIRTLQVVQHLRPGGLEKLVLNLMRFASPRHHVYIASLEGNASSEIKAWPELSMFKDQLIFLNKPQGVDIKTAYQLRKVIQNFNITTVHSHHLGPLLYSRLAMLGLNLTHIHTEHDSWHLRDPKQKSMTRWLLKSNKIALVADAPSVAKEIQQLLGRSANHIIYNGIDCHFFCIGDQTQARRYLNLPLDATFIGCAGRLVSEKGIDTMIHALSSLPTHYQLVIAGDGYESLNLKRLARKLGVATRIHWLGYCDDMRYFYRAINVFCMPSRHEGLPLALLEAQASGKPIVATRIGAIPDFTYPDSSQLVVPDNPKQLSQALQQVITQNICEHKIAHFTQQFADVRTMTAAYEALGR